MDHVNIAKSGSPGPCLGGPEQREIQPFISALFRWTHGPHEDLEIPLLPALFRWT